MLPEERGIPVVRARYRSIIAHLHPDIVIDSPAWFAWLEQPETQRFAFYEDESDGCLFHAQKREGVWYAYRQNKAPEIEIGSSDTVTIAALWSAYDRLMNDER